MTKPVFIPLDETARQAVTMAGLTSHSEVTEPEAARKHAQGSALIFVTSQIDAGLPERLQHYKGRKILLFPDPEENKGLAETLLKSDLVLIPVRVESLARLSFSQAVKSLETLFVELSPDDFNLGEEDIFDVLRPHLFHRFYHAEGRHLREAVLRMAHRIRSLRHKESVAYTLRVPAQTPLYSLDEALDVLEVALPPDKPLLFAIRFENKSDNTRISALVGSPFHLRSDLQSRIDAQPTYLGKTAVIVESFAFREIDEKRMAELCRDNGIEPEDADRLYDLVYVRADETAELIRKLREARTAQEREEMVAQALSEGFIDVKILEELTHLFGLSPHTILARAETLKAQGGANA
ncbi:hypothetical protein [Hydrogenimonas sp. SS33]|uniref:hypothetical protein n=1 Tax=Hydrogenimonas leucolamina TaxID=2954236 RepID=UPI00336BB88B